MNTKEQQLLSEIQRRYKQGETAWHLNDIALLLSLVKSQEAGVTTELYQVATKVLRWLYATMSPKTGDKSLLKVKQFEIHKELEQAILKAHATRVNADIAATSTRSACVEKVKAMRDAWLQQVKDNRNWKQWCNAADFIITELESLSIEKPKE